MLGIDGVSTPLDLKYMSPKSINDDYRDYTCLLIIAVRDHECQFLATFYIHTCILMSFKVNHQTVYVDCFKSADQCGHFRSW